MYKWENLPEKPSELLGLALEETRSLIAKDADRYDLKRRIFDAEKIMSESGLFRLSYAIATLDVRTLSDLFHDDHALKKLFAIDLMQSGDVRNALWHYGYLSWDKVWLEDPYKGFAPEMKEGMNFFLNNEAWFAELEFLKKQLINMGC